MRLVITALPLFAFLLTGTAGEIPAYILNLTRMERRMTDELKRLPNYTCLETIDRYSAGKGGKMRRYDRIRVNVAIVDGKELYAWPGGKRFEDRSLAEMVHSGFISDGDFAAMARNVFEHRNAAISYAGQKSRDGRTLLRYNFDISQMRSGWQVRLRNASGVVGATGWFEADAATLDLVRFSFAAVDIPLFSQDKTLEESVEYGRVTLGTSDILIPLVVDLRSESYTGEAHWNHGTFSDCHQYAAETSISF